MIDIPARPPIYESQASGRSALLDCKEDQLKEAREAHTTRVSLREKGEAGAHQR